MNLEKLLTEQKGETLTDKLNGPALRAFINANLKRVGVEPVDTTTTCDVILERIYSIEDTDIQTKILERQISELNSDTNYKRLSMYGSLILAAIITVLGIDSVFGGNLSPEAIEALKMIGSGVIQILSGGTTSV